MYCSISCSRAWRSPCSWYRRRRILSLSGTRPPLDQPDAPTVDLHLVHCRLEHPLHAELRAGVPLECVEHALVERADDGLERVVVDRQADDELAVVRTRAAVEQGAEGDLQVFEVLEGQIEP